MWANLLAGEIVSGASTITQQVSRMLFLTREETVSRKLKEAILAFKIERSYTKKEILTFYCNLLHFGHGLYGVEAASEYYFGKKAQRPQRRGSRRCSWESPLLRRGTTHS